MIRIYRGNSLKIKELAEPLLRLIHPLWAKTRTICCHNCSNSCCSLHCRRYGRGFEGAALFLQPSETEEISSFQNMPPSAYVDGSMFLSDRNFFWLRPGRIKPSSFSIYFYIFISADSYIIFLRFQPGNRS